MASRYNLTTVRGGKHDAAIEQALAGLWDALEKGQPAAIKLRQVSRWEGEDGINLQSGYADFLDQTDHTFSPVATKAAVRVLHKKGFRGSFQIEVSGYSLTIDPCAAERRSTDTECARGGRPSQKSVEDAESLWTTALAHPVPLLRAASDEPSLALFDEKGFFLSQAARKVYDLIKHLPHIYVARLESGTAYYFGISTQRGGRWKRSHAYHLGGLAHEILGTTRYDDQNHSHWVREWFEPFSQERREGFFAIRVKERIAVSFFAPRPQATRGQLLEMESGLIALAREKGLVVLNK
jgi:hypothetical protein